MPGKEIAMAKDNSKLQQHRKMNFCDPGDHKLSQTQIEILKKIQQNSTE